MLNRLGNKEESVQCTNVLDNKMRCAREATIAKLDDPENKEAICAVCYAFSDRKEEYDG